MTRDELKTTLTPIVCDLSLTKEERAVRIGPIARSWMDEKERDGGKLNLDEVFNEWNLVMVEIVEENNLGRQ